MKEPLTAAEWDALPPVLTAEQVGQVFGVTAAQVLRWANAGTLPAVLIGRQWRFSKEQLMQQGAPREQHEGPGPGGSADR